MAASVTATSQKHNDRPTYCGMKSFLYSSWLARPWYLRKRRLNARSVKEIYKMWN